MLLKLLNPVHPRKLTWTVTIPAAGGTRIMTSRARHDSAGVRLHRLVTYTPEMSPEKSCLEDECSFKHVHFQGLC